MKLSFKIKIILFLSATIPLLLSGVCFYLFYYFFPDKALGLYGILTTASALILFSTLGIYFSISATNRELGTVFNKLSVFVEAIASADPKKYLESNSIEGLGAFANTLNQMADRLTEVHTEMDKNVKETTDELLNKVEEVNKSNKAVLNLLDDIDKEKSRAEAMVVVRTKELSDERTRLLASINSLSFGFIIADTNHRVLFKNRAMIDLFGQTEKDNFSVLDISKMLGGRMDVLTEVNKCLVGSGVCEIKEIVFDRKILRGIVAPVAIEESKEKLGYVFLLEDITEAKVMERSREEFFAVASHELRTPLTAIRGNTEMILDLFGDKITDPEMREMLKDIDASSVRLIGIVNDFLEVSRIEQGKLEIKSESFDLPEMVTKIVKNLQGVVSNKNITLNFVTSLTSVPKVFADKNRVEQVIINLIGNSLKFTKEGGISINLEKTENLLKVVVSDTGIGISEKNQGRLFRKFQQAGEDMIARDVTQGTGLGLYISQLLVTAMGGTIGLVKSELGKGSTFAFTVPIVS